MLCYCTMDKDKYWEPQFKGYTISQAIKIVSLDKVSITKRRENLV